MRRLQHIHPSQHPGCNAHLAQCPGCNVLNLPSDIIHNAQVATFSSITVPGGCNVPIPPPVVLLSTQPAMLSCSTAVRLQRCQPAFRHRAQRPGFNTPILPPVILHSALTFNALIPFAALVAYTAPRLQHSHLPFSIVLREMHLLNVFI
jgi:hypothetical protein